MSSDPDQNRIRRARRGDREAIATLWERHQPWLHAVLLAHAPAGVDPEDLLQDVATAFVRRIGDLEEPGALRSWLRTIAVNLARSAARRQQVRATRPLDLESEPEDPRPDRRRRSEQLEARVRRTLDLARSLPIEYREPLLLKAVRGWSQKEIAQLLDLTEAAVESRLARGRTMLRNRLARSTQERTKPCP